MTEIVPTGIIAGLYRGDPGAVLAAARAASVDAVDTAANYANGSTFELLAGHQPAWISTKVGFWPSSIRPPSAENDHHHSLAPSDVSIGLSAMSEAAGRPFDLVYAHNPEVALDLGQSPATIWTDVVAGLGEACASGIARGWGVATWTGFAAGSPLQLEDLLATADRLGALPPTAVMLPGGPIHHGPALAARRGTGPIPLLVAAGIPWVASAPLGGGALTSGRTLSTLATALDLPSDANLVSAAFCRATGAHAVAMGTTVPARYIAATVGFKQTIQLGALDTVLDALDAVAVGSTP